MVNYSGIQDVEMATFAPSKSGFGKDFVDFLI